MAFRVLTVIGGLILIIVGSGLFVLFTGSINAAEPDGSPMATGSYFKLWPVVLVLDLVFLSLVVGGVKLAGFGWTVFGWIIIVVGIGILSLGIWNHIDGPHVDYDSTRTDDRFPVPPAVNGIVYIWAGVTLLGGLLFVATSRARRIE